jgi:DNA polymerase-4
MSSRPRCIVHLDLDAFFASVEMAEDPTLRDKPVLVGARPEERGVVASASYPARIYGVRSAMPMGWALQLCPHAITVPPRHKLYAAYSRRVMAMLPAVTSLVEQMSIDEAVLDLSYHIGEWDDGVNIARDLQARVREEAGLSASLGVATNKLVAKVASDQDKPGGLTVVRPGEEAAFLVSLPVRVLWGVGPVTEQKLSEMGVSTVGQLTHVSEQDLVARFGRHGRDMARQARGIDTRRVITEHERKSVSHERTFASDLREADALQEPLWKMSQGVARRLQKVDKAARTVAIKLRYGDFTTLTRQMSLAVPTNDDRDIYRAAAALLNRTWERGRGVRLLGVAGRELCEPAGQLPLF